MYFPNQMLVLLIWVPILVQSQQQERCNRNNRPDCLGWARQGLCQSDRNYMQTNCRKSCNLCNNVITGGCNTNSQCRTAEYCNQGRCVDDPCSRVRCPSTCRVVQGQAQCDPISERCNGDNTRECVDLANKGQCVRNRDFMQANCRKSCNLCNDVITGCSANSQCGNAGICDRGTCVADPCVVIKCGANKRCVALGGGQVECQPIPECSANSQCSNNGICDRGRCVVNPCSPSPCGTNNKCVVVRGEVQCQPLQESIVSDRDISQGAGVGGNTQDSSQGVSNSGGFQIGNQAGVSAGANKGDAGQESNQNASAKGGNHESGSSAAPKRCNDKSDCKDNEICEKGNCISPCDLIQCPGQGASCKVIVGGTAGTRAQCFCPPGTTGSPFVKCTPIEDNNRNNANLPPPGTEKPAASVLGCKINSQCGANERCQSGRCVNPCALFECVEGAKCQVSQRQPQCFCPPGTKGEPREGCKLNTGNAVGVTQPPSSVTNQPSTSSVTSSDTSFPEGPNQVPGKGTRLQGCETDPDPGECRGAFPRYYYNKEKDQCDCFLFGGCDIEGVRFTWTTFDECLNKCVPGNTTKGTGCKRVSVDEVKEFLEQQRRDRENNGR